jgi:hypothetical protein
MEAGLSLNAASKALNDIFAPYGIGIDVTIDDVFTDRSWDIDGDGKLSVQGSSFFSEYTKEMDALNKAYKDQRDLVNEAAILFVFGGESAQGSLLLGDMPLENRFGYLFGYTSGALAWKTMAHELGHGVLQLRHTFGSRYNIEVGTTSNLMDYSHGTELKKYQWDAIHDPQKRLLSWWQKEEDGAFEAYEYLAGKNVVLGKFINVEGISAINGLSFISSAGWVITIPTDAIDVTFNDNGTLMGFTIKENGRLERYIGAQYVKGDNDAGQFAGFLFKFFAGDVFLRLLALRLSSWC